MQNAINYLRFFLHKQPKKANNQGKSLAYKSIRFNNFRNLQDAELQLEQEVYFLVGANGAGKSSLLESLYLLSYGSSFREKNLSHCLRSPQQIMHIEGTVTQNKQPFQLQVQYENEGSKKSISLNGKKLADRKELLSITPSIVFAHGDIQYINGSPRLKRQFIDQTISLLDPNYIDLNRNYSKCLQQRNWVLKNKQKALLSTYSQQLVQLGLKIQQQRQKHIYQLNKIFSQLFSYVSSMCESVHLQYQPSWKDEDPESILDFLEQRSERDWLLGATQTGPHRDQLLFRISNDKQREKQEIEQAKDQDFTRLASTGQMRLAALILKSAQANYLQRQNPLSNVLLLDDVLLEMDSHHRQLFLASLPAYQQVFFTFLPNEDFSAYPFPNYQIITVEQGRFQQL